MPRTEPSGRAFQPEVADLSRWTETILLAARHLGLANSPELVRGAARWADASDTARSVVEMAAAAGLDGQFAEIPATALTDVLLPALVCVDGQHVGMIVAVAGGKAALHLPTESGVVERTPALASLAADGRLRLLLLRERETPRSDRLDAHLAARPREWLGAAFSANWKTMLELGVGSLFGNLLAIATSLFAMQVWDRVVPARSIHTLWVLAAGVALALLLELAIRTARVAIADHFGKQVDLKLSAMFFARVLDIRNDARPQSPGTLVAQLRDLEQLRELLTSSTLGVLIDLPFVLAFLFIIWLLGGWLVLVPLLAIPLLVLPGLVAQVPLAKLSTQGMAESALRNAILMESIYRVEDIKALQAEPRFRKIWQHTNEVNGEIGLRQRFLAGLLVNFAQTVQQIAYAGVLVAGVYGILDGDLSFGAVLACSILTSRTIAPLAQIPAVLGRIQNARVGKQALDTLLTLPLDHEPGRDAYHRTALVGRYRFENVVYGYDPNEKPVLTVPDLRIEPGERVAILGRVGAGKSTLLRLLAGLSTPQQGRVVFNDTPMPMIDVADVRRDVGVVLQEASLFYGTLRDNLLVASPLATDDALLAALRLACADQLLLNQPHGLDLRIRENGVGLSGGQRQALILARTLLRSPSVLLLDEPTASLDEATELAVIRQLGEWLGGRTLVVATHRYPVLQLVDRLIVVDHGRIVRDGPRDEVLATLRGPAPATRTAAPNVRAAE
ncbi:type I secretion system permease/ATPase [Cupriavidus agavae]|uniref:Cyclolysin secretion/processing ATP-binding protein CyaB n=1 Tax=Cupriavidus agavae TaxID=1001822 RepID=A0A4Q7RZL2_9BURK|nr:type I secretion system permease/ATPase [Cupriavidus agavae]RZT39341.1 ATP-binding cassette subfamily C protein LapB [Cupriavidus agavae]